MTKNIKLLLESSFFTVPRTMTHNVLVYMCFNCFKAEKNDTCILLPMLTINIRIPFLTILNIQVNSGACFRVDVKAPINFILIQASRL